MKNIEFKDNLLYIDNKLIPIKFDISLFINGILQVTELPESFIKTSSELRADGNLYFKCDSSPELMEYSDIFLLNIELLSPINFKLYQDIKMLHGLNITNFIRGTLEFNLNTEEGNYAYGVFQEYRKKLIIDQKIIQINSDFINQQIIIQQRNVQRKKYGIMIKQNN